jgi:hypothetical protein
MKYNLQEYGNGGTDTDVIGDPNDYLCTIHLLKYHIKNNLPPDWTVHLFLKQYKKEVLNLSRFAMDDLYC